MRQAGSDMIDLEDVRLFVHRGVLYLQFVGHGYKYEEKGMPREQRGREWRQWLGRLDHEERVRCQHPQHLRPSTHCINRDRN